MKSEQKQGIYFLATVRGFICIDLLSYQAMCLRYEYGTCLIAVRYSFMNVLMAEDTHLQGPR